MCWAGLDVLQEEGKVRWSTSRNSVCQLIRPPTYTHTHIRTHTPTPLTAICISASVRPFPDQKHSQYEHTQSGSGSQISWCVMPSFLIFLQNLRKEAAPLFFFLFCLWAVSPDSSCSSVWICCSCGGRRCHSVSHESLLCGQSDHLDRDPASAGRTQRKERGPGAALAAEKQTMCDCVHVCLCLHDKRMCVHHQKVETTVWCRCDLLGSYLLSYFVIYC